jgi:hypothetical protein
LLTSCRHAHPELRRKTYVNDNDVQWHGEAAFKPDWTDSSRLVAYTLKKTAPQAGGLYVAFNSGHTPKVVELPHWPGRAWKVRCRGCGVEMSYRAVLAGIIIARVLTDMRCGAVRHPAVKD